MLPQPRRPLQAVGTVAALLLLPGPLLHTEATRFLLRQKLHPSPRQSLSETKFGPRLTAPTLVPLPLHPILLRARLSRSLLEVPVNLPSILPSLPHNPVIPLSSNCMLRYSYILPYSFDEVVIVVNRRTTPLPNLRSLTLVANWLPADLTLTCEFLSPLSIILSDLPSSMPVADGLTSNYPTWSIVVNDTAPIWAYCRQKLPASHCGAGMVLSVKFIFFTSRQHV